MTTKSPANAAHDAARAEDEQRARAELHEYITGLERQLRTRAEVADHARATLNEHLAAAEKQLAEVTRERDLAQAAERTFALRLRLVHEALGDPECEVVLTSDLVARRIHEAEERGARWALDYERGTPVRPGHTPRDVLAARICAEARAKGG